MTNLEQLIYWLERLIDEGERNGRLSVDNISTLFLENIKNELEKIKNE